MLATVDLSWEKKIEENPGVPIEMTIYHLLRDLGDCIADAVSKKAF